MLRSEIILMITAVVPCFTCQLHAGNIEFRRDAIIRPGEVYDIVSVYDTPPDTSTVNMFGGSVNGVQSYDSSIVNIHDGQVWGSIIARDFSTVNIHGGSLHLEYFAVSGLGTLNIYAGDVRIGNSPIFSDSSSVNIYGYGFDYDGVRVLRGFLSDDAAFLMSECYPSDYAHLNLIVIPEPTTIVLLGFATILVRKRGQ
jgi:hypothetical protein